MAKKLGYISLGKLKDNVDLLLTMGCTRDTEILKIESLFDDELQKDGHRRLKELHIVLPYKEDGDSNTYIHACIKKEQPVST